MRSNTKMPKYGIKEFLNLTQEEYKNEIHRNFIFIFFRVFVRAVCVARGGMNGSLNEGYFQINIELIPQAQLAEHTQQAELERTRGVIMKTLLFLAKGFETMEFSVFVDVMGWARNDYGCNTQVITCGFQKQVMSTFNIPVIVDKLIDEIIVDDFDALAIPGGFEEFGFYEETYSDRFLNLIKEFDSKGKIIATICVAALPLGKSGILNNRKATTYHLRGGYKQNQLREFGVNVINEPIVVDNKVITSYCPETAAGVAFKLLEMLTSKEQMETVKYAMGY